MRGTPVRSPENVAKAIALRAEGLKYREIGERMGISVKTAHEWVTDADGAKRAKRRAAYQGECFLCGGPTDGSYGPGTAGELCQACRRWSDEAIIAAIQTWAAEHGGIPPTCTEWRVADTDHPCADVVIKRLGWNSALLRAGFALKCDRRPETQDWIVQQLRAGVSTEDIADAVGVTAQAIVRRLRYRGLTVTQARTGAAA